MPVTSPVYSHQSYGDDEIDSNEDDDENSNSEEESGCKFRDGTHSATVDYFNPETGYRKTYTLDVEVDNCEVVQIDFPKGGWLDEDHISAEELDSDGSCSITGDEGRTYDIQIDD